MFNRNKFSKSSKAPKFGNELDFASKEAYNTLRTNIMFSFIETDEGKVLGITSANPSEGKTFTSINLANSIAEAGHKVLLIDADMRCGTVAKNLKLQSAPGLSNLLVYNEKNVIHKNVLHENLSVITAGDAPPNPSELLGSENMNAVLKLFRDHFDFVILDLPPVTVVSDPVVVSKYIDGMLLVVLHGRTKKAEVYDSLNKLKITGVHMLGFVYNGYRSEGAFGQNNYGYEKFNYYDKYAKSSKSKK